MNVVVLIGRLVRDPELRYIQSGDAVANFTIAVDRDFSGRDGKREADFIDIVAWKKTAEIVTQYLSKGNMVGIRGRIQVRNWQTQDGQKRKSFEVVAETVQFLSPAEKGTDTEAVPESTNDDGEVPL